MNFMRAERTFGAIDSLAGTIVRAARGLSGTAVGFAGIRDVGCGDDAIRRYGQAKRRMGSIPVSGAISRIFLSRRC
ncbi:hypothetical protein PWG15_31965 (plasmid) [Ensifer adhaerens]|uniref:hypothetical protein n=1 Tax=Ensifer adhaerens TaxID=106592 RepID=UPI0023A94F23|nr:hypothetical protein [Ensifer adhaerens]WDZ80038.1 hypothetical protein PWG15_31965 [Ensifer adhaerens]